MQEAYSLDALAREVALLSEAFREALGAADSLDALQTVKVQFFGKKGQLTAVLKGLGQLPSEARAEAGAVANAFKEAAFAQLSQKEGELEDAHLKAGLLTERIDITLPARHLAPAGHLHPLQQALDEITGIFSRMGFALADGPEIETDYYNFEALNIPAGHPARDMQDTFYLPGGLLLRTHTSPVQIRFMERVRPPFQIIAPGKVYRRDSDISHTPMFHQVEGLAVAEGLSMAHLKGVLEAFLHAFFGKDAKIRLRPSFFPFTEPSCEVDVSCIFCEGNGCPVCKQGGWLEVMGAGMVHPKVLQNVGCDPEVLSGFAFGIGVERLAMLRYRVGDIRQFYENKLEFLQQF